MLRAPLASIRWLLLAVFCAVPILGIALRPFAGRVVWTIIVAALPLFIVLVGYHRWRRICPLYFFAQVPVLLHIQQGRRAPKWLEANYYYIALVLFAVSLWLRLIAINGDGYAIAIFFVGLAVLAFILGAAFTGRTWCNYFCPVSFIEKIYTEPRGLATTANSQCAVCTACKSSCPDINEENGYWKEIGLRSKRFAYFAFPGLVLGFYLYFFLQAGSWDDYFSGAWTRQIGLAGQVWTPGHDSVTAGFFFLAQIPRALASALTLAACAGLSLLAFAVSERFLARLGARSAWSDTGRLRHGLLSVAAFTAFVAFYTFAGQPTLRHLPAAAGAAMVIAVAVATVLLVRRLQRTQADYVDEAVARGVVKRWQWIDLQPPADLHDALLVHRTRVGESRRGHAQALAAYHEAVRSTVEDGFVTPRQVRLLSRLRQQLQITDAEQERLLMELEEAERTLLSEPGRQLLPDKRLQLETYRVALERYLGAHPRPAPAEETYLRRLRAEYRVTPEEHVAVLAGILGGIEVFEQVTPSALEAIERLALAREVLAREMSPLFDLLGAIALRAQERTAALLAHYLGTSVSDGASERLTVGLASAGRDEREAAVKEVCERLPPVLAEPITSAYSRLHPRQPSAGELRDALLLLVGGADPYGRALAALALWRRSLADDATLRRLETDGHALVRQTAGTLRQRDGMTRAEEVDERAFSTVERMVALHGVAIFAALPPEELVSLAQSSAELDCEPGAVICDEGQAGESVFLVLSGLVEVYRRLGQAQHLVGQEGAGAVLGEMAVLAPAPRAATLLAGPDGAHLMRLEGAAFADALHASPVIAGGVIRSLVQRLRSMVSTGAEA